MKNLINEILQDLYKLDPDLMKKEKQIKDIIEDMISSKPKVEIDEVFKNQLKNLILQEISSSSVKWNFKKTNNIFMNILFALWWIAVWIWGFAIFFNMVFVPQYSTKLWKEISKLNSQNDLKLSFDTKINKVWDRAFGDIATIDTWNTWKVQSWTMVANWFETQVAKVDAPKGPEEELQQVVNAVNDQIQAKDNNTVPQISNQPTTVETSDSAGKGDEIKTREEQVETENDLELTLPTTNSASSDLDDSSVSSNSWKKLSWKAMISDSVEWWSSQDMYVPTVYIYIYSWEKLDMTGSQMPVYKKNIVGFDDKDFVSIIKKIDTWKIDMSKFSNLKMDSLMVSEDNEFGFDMSISFEDGIIYFSKNYKKRPISCLDQAKISSSISPLATQQCVDYKIKITDIPSDETLLKIAADFVGKYSIDIKDFGTPVVDNYRKLWYENSLDKDNYYLPDTINVIYPRVVDGKEVYEEFWQKKWLKISIDIKQQKVSWMNSLEKLNFDVSNYEVDNNFNNMVSVAEKWWRYGFSQTYMDNFKVKKIILSTPEIKYIDYYNYKDWLSQEYLIPSYVFPIDRSNLKADEYVASSVVVPLTKDFYNYDGSGNIVWIKN